MCPTGCSVVFYIKEEMKIEIRKSKRVEMKDMRH